MLKINDTVSLCEHCYRHVSATKIVRDNKIYLGKTCPIHGYHETLVESDADFYINTQLYTKRTPSSYWLDITNRCNLDCPHCYQMPDNKSIDPSIDYILSQISSLPDNGWPISLVGAEPTTRKDLATLVKEIQKLPMKPRKIMIVSNVVNLAKRHYAEKFVGIPELYWTFGVNHKDYNGVNIREKQLQGIKNCAELGLNIKTLTYTTSELSQVPDILEEIQEWKSTIKFENARLQLGVEIGRTPDHATQELYLSDLVKFTKDYCDKKNYSFKIRNDLSNRTHYAVDINGVTHRLIKWVDVKTIDLEETFSESFAQLVPNKPMSPLLHQVILRDRVINNNIMLYDTIPEKYRYAEN